MPTDVQALTCIIHHLLLTCMQACQALAQEQVELEAKVAQLAGLQADVAALRSRAAAVDSLLAQVKELRELAGQERGLREQLREDGALVKAAETVEALRGRIAQLTPQAQQLPELQVRCWRACGSCNA
jgi:hypothetical protein